MSQNVYCATLYYKMAQQGRIINTGRTIGLIRALLFPVEGECKKPHERGALDTQISFSQMAIPFRKAMILRFKPFVPLAQSYSDVVWHTAWKQFCQFEHSDT